ncbi:hypothetical protein BDF14DRAFT_1788919 [Spinellus fusiger]|nr:hypothetical protein BDF14DRAFT_1788912 [Spinellus fusiger]KAI7868888.1 hypothetical protein BDF14DRAFT_1788919 [Spinellus fusiger]
MTASFDFDIPREINEFNDIHKRITYIHAESSNASKPLSVVQSLPTFDAEGKPCFKAYSGSNKLEGKYALITGGHSGIGRSISTMYALEGVAGITIVYRDESEDKIACYAKKMIEGQSKCKVLLIARDIGYEATCQEVVDAHMAAFGRIDILINNAGEGSKPTLIENTNSDKVESIFRTNIFGPIYLCKIVCKHLIAGGVIINTSSVASAVGAGDVIPYSASKAAINSLTRTLAAQLAPRNIRVNAVAPGITWTPILHTALDENVIDGVISTTPMKRLAQPSEIATVFVFLASDSASFMTGQIVHPNGGTAMLG